MKITRYECELCGAPIEKLEDITKVIINFDSTNEHNELTYHACPFCSSVINNMRNEDIESILLEQLKLVINKQND